MGESSAAGGPASETEWVVIRPRHDVDASDLASVFEGEWRRRAELADPTGLDLDGPQGVVRAVPTGRTETAPDGHVAEVWEVPDHESQGDGGVKAEDTSG